MLVVDREAEAGGIPRHSDHTGYGMRDLRTVLRGPVYARRLVDRATDAGADLRTSTMITGWGEGLSCDATSPAGRLRIEPRAVLLATGARERPRSARLVPGDRPAGVLTTGELQNRVHLHHERVGERAVVVGAELVSWSAVLTLRDAGCRTVLMTTTHPQAEAYRALSLGGRTLLDGPLARSTRVTRVNGRERVTSVEIEHLPTGRRRTIACDTVVFTGDWIPDNELARAAGIAIDPASRAPIVDMALRTMRDGVFAAGNLVHPVDTADVASLDGAHVADAIRRWLDGDSVPAPMLRLRAAAPFHWVTPSVVRADGAAPARDRLLLWSDVSRALPVVEVRQGDAAWRRRITWPLAPGRMFRLPWSICDRVDPAGGDVTIGLAS